LCNFLAYKQLTNFDEVCITNGFRRGLGTHGIHFHGLLLLIQIEIVTFKISC